MKAIILAGGEGTRLRPLTVNVAKPVVPVMNKPVIVHIIDLLYKYGISEIAVTLKYLPQTVKDTIALNYPENKIEFYVENTPLGTAGSVRNCKEFIDSDFLVISGDAITDIDLSSAINYHLKNKNKITIITKKVNYPSEYGVVLTDKNNYVVGFNEKPSTNEATDNLVNTGIYLVNPSVMSYFTENKEQDFARDIFPAMLNNNEVINSFEVSGYWCDIGDYNTYREANLFLLDKTGERAYVGKNCKISDSALIQNCIIGDDCKIGENVIIRNSILWRNSKIENEVNISDSIICNNTTIMSGSDINSTIIGSDSTLENNVKTKPRTKIWPGTIVLKESVINGVIKDSFDAKTPVFDNDGVCAVGNYSPDFTVKLGASFGTFLGRTSSCIVGNDNDGAAQMIAYGIKTGLAATSVQVKTSSDSLPVIRWMIRSGLADAGVYISGGKNSRVIFLNNKGNDLAKNDRKKLLSIYRIGDYIYAPKSEILPVERLSEAEDYYVSELMKIFSCPYRNLNYIGNKFSPSQKQAIIAFLTVKMYPDSPLFAPANSLLPTSHVSKKYDRYLIKCGNNRGDIMSEMEKLMHIPGVYTQYLMLTDDLAFDLGLSCLEYYIKTENDNFYTITQLSPPVYKLSATRVNTRKNPSELLKELKNMCNGEILDGISIEKQHADAHISCNEDGNLFNIFVESFSEEYAKDLMGNMLEIFEKLLT